VHVSQEAEANHQGYVKAKNEDYPNVEMLGIPPNHDDERKLSVKYICDILATEFDIHHVMVEGGPSTAIQFLKEGIVDRAIFVTAPIKFKDPLPSGIDPATHLKKAGLQHVGTYQLGVDTVDCYSRPNLPWPTASISSWP
jgi:riboflavin biosynthesis pyrimidine reductase